LPHPRRVSPISAPHMIIGYHGCSRQTAETVLTENRFLMSTNSYDWLGEGIYFWEYAPFRALEWARERCQREHLEPAVLRVTVHLGQCLNLLDREHFDALDAVYTRVAQNIPAHLMPRNNARGAHHLDRSIIDAYCRFTQEETNTPFQTIRGCFPEGEPIYPDSKLLKKTHTQIAVRDSSCISQVRLVQFP